MKYTESGETSGEDSYRFSWEFDLYKVIMERGKVCTHYKQVKVLTVPIF